MKQFSHIEILEHQGEFEKVFVEYEKLSSDGENDYVLARFIFILWYGLTLTTGLETKTEDKYIEKLKGLTKTYLNRVNKYTLIELILCQCCNDFFFFYFGIDEKNISTMISSSIKAFPNSELLRIYTESFNEPQSEVDPVKVHQELTELFPGDSLMDNYFIEYFEHYK